MDKINDPGCVMVAVNTGNPECIMIPDKFVYGYLIPKGKVFTAVEVQSIVATLQALALAGPSVRLLPIGEFVEMKDNSGDVSFKEHGYGSKQITREGKYDWSYKLIDGGVGLQNNLRTLNRSQRFDILFLDDSNVLWGKDGGSGKLRGIPLEFIYAYPWKANDGSNPAAFEIRFGLKDPRDFNEYVAYVKPADDTEIKSAVLGIVDLHLAGCDTHTATKLYVSVTTKLGRVNLYDTYSTQLAAAGMWLVKNHSTGAVIAVSAVAAKPLVSGFELTITSTPATAVDVTLTTPALLAAANIGGAPNVGYEADTLAITTP